MMQSVLSNTFQTCVDEIGSLERDFGICRRGNRILRTLSQPIGDCMRGGEERAKWKSTTTPFLIEVEVIIESQIEQKTSTGQTSLSHRCNGLPKVQLTAFTTKTPYFHILRKGRERSIEQIADEKWYESNGI
ncbi:hypothetical protein CDAR_194801 [Caerostris darwini]|uniref:Uncharacterized protein n=1 Tax=Caerostris darwini TaxID=1538125 RepID=A0AAV4X711_9ARAC|nr:hypothetical protein CDAR_194801 [Caerostris darwini]